MLDFNESKFFNNTIVSEFQTTKTLQVTPSSLFVINQTVNGKSLSKRDEILHKQILFQSKLKSFMLNRSGYIDMLI